MKEEWALSSVRIRERRVTNNVRPYSNLPINVLQQQHKSLHPNLSPHSPSSTVVCHLLICLQLCHATECAARLRRDGRRCQMGVAESAGAGGERDADGVLVDSALRERGARTYVAPKTAQ